MSKSIISLLLIAFSMISVTSAAGMDVFEVETEGQYRMTTSVSSDQAKTVALFNAQRKALELAGRYLARKNLIKTYGLKKDEIYCLAAREIDTKILDQKRETTEKDTTYRLRISARVQVSDFVKAEMADLEQKKDEARESYQDEMEQPVSAAIDPGIDIAKAYRLLREEKWRITMIYLDRLEKKYPNWDSIYMAKALTHFILNEPVFMKEALSEACRLGNHTACDDLNHIKRLHEHDFGLSIVQ